jgi:FMN phosphatase YigB (HAD superfamily)
MTNSFDIFDTCLTRRVAAPAEVFDQMAERLELGNNFRFFRQEAEREAMRRFQDATLAEIYGILSDWLGWDPAKLEEIMADELEEEARQLIPISEALQQVDECRAKGGGVAFISDMYLPSCFLVNVLRSYGFYKSGDSLFVSCEYRKSKSSGKLYEAARQHLGSNILNHYGNHFHADVVSVRKAGSNATYYSWGNLTRYEELLNGWRTCAQEHSRSWAGASRVARCAVGPLNLEEQVIASVSSGVAGPLVYIFASWLVERAEALRLKKLFFLSRDGQVFMDAFTRIVEKRGLKIHAHYLHASRIAVRFPVNFPLSDEDAAGVFQGSGMVPVTTVAARLGIPEVRLRSWLPDTKIRGNMILSAEIMSIRSILSSPDIVKELADVASTRSNLLVNYLQQEGFLDEPNPTVVDLGWNGTLQAGLQKALTREGMKAKVRGLYLGLATFAYPELVAEALIYDSRVKGSTFECWITGVSELLCQANHGSVLGFERSASGNIQPRFDHPDGENSVVSNWFDLHRSTIRQFISEALTRTTTRLSTAAYRPLLISLLETFWLEPNPAEGHVWGECRFASHGTSDTKEAIAPRPKSPVAILCALGIVRKCSITPIWMEGTTARLPSPLFALAKCICSIKKSIKCRL